MRTPEAFDYAGFEPMDDHGSRFVNRKRKDKYGLRLQVAGPWKPEGCSMPSEASPAWMRLLVLRRDRFRCQGCGSDGGEESLEVQHIRAVRDLAKEQGFEEAGVTPMSAAEFRRNSIYNRIGACGHNLVTLCHRCHARRKGRGGAPPFRPAPRLESFREGRKE